MIAMKKILFIVVSAIAVLVSCTRAERFDLVGGDDLQIRFTPSIDTYTLKSSDAGFDNGDAISITALNPINAVNVKYIYRDGTLVPENGEGISWLSNQKTKTLFYAIYPYRENFVMNNDGTFGDSADDPNALLLEVESDQSTYDGYSRSNLLGCSAQGTPGEPVTLSFYHNVSKVVIIVDNKLGVRLTEAYLSGIYGRSMRYGEGPIGTLGAIKANPDGENQWKLVTVPQSGISPVIVLKAADGKEYNFACPYGGLTFRQGYQCTLSVVLDENVSSNFTSEISEWSEDKEYVFDHDTYVRNKQLASLFEELAGDYNATTTGAARTTQWVMKLIPVGSKIGFFNLFANSSWADTDTMFYGDISDDLSSIIIPYGQTAEYVYSNGYPLTLYGLDATVTGDDEDDGVYEGNTTVTIVRDATTGAITGLDFGERYGFWAYIKNAGTVGYCYPHITATKVTE